MKEYRKASELNEKCEKLAEKCRDEKILFNTKMLKAKIWFQLLKSKEEKINKAMALLQKLLDSAHNKDETATINYELAMMNLQIGRVETAEKQKQKAKELLLELFEKTKDIEYEKQVKELEKGFENE